MFVSFIETTIERQAKVLGDLNSRYLSYVLSGKTIKEAYSMMVKDKPFRILANATHDWEENPLNPDNDDVSQ